VAPTGSAGADDSAPAGIGIKLLEAPTNRRDDPRARIYIVDHLAPGSTIKRRIQVENTTGQHRQVKMYAGAASIGKDGFGFAEEPEQTELTSWTSVDKPVLEMAPESKETVQLTIAVPPSAPVGERYAVIWAENPAPRDVVGQVGRSNRVGIRVYLDIGLGGEPPSDFVIDSLTPGRTPDGRPKLIAQVRNTGGRALDMTGQLWLSEGPGSLNAGPFPVTLGRTLGLGFAAPVTVLLDRQLPNGPWTARLTLRSGMVERTVTVQITFPDSGLGAPVPVGASDTPDYLLFSALGALALAALSGFLLVRFRRRHRLKRSLPTADS
jgi:hypothetical protein